MSSSPSVPLPSQAEGSCSPFTSPDHPLLIFFDGRCVFCNRWVDRLLRADASTARLRYGPKDGITFARVAARFPAVAQVESLVVLVQDETGHEHPEIRSRAVAAIISRLPGFAFACLRLLLQITPTFLADFGYRIFSKLRYFLFGTTDSCRRLAPSERDRFVD